MNETTATQTYADLRPLSDDRPRRLGVVVVFSEHDPRPGAYPVTGRLRAGRDAALDLVVDDPKASRHHADLEASASGVVVHDRGSHNGTFIDGVRVPASASGVVAPVGSALRLGTSLLCVVDDIDAYADYPPPPREPLIGGPGLDAVRRQIARCASGTAPVLVHGETGTGKERAARAVHEASGRRGDLVAVNCAALPHDLVEAELFGHARGAFSGSHKARPGLFRSAHGGTLVLDEIGELPLGLQAKLLRAVESGEVRPVGEDQPVPIDVRIVAATNRALPAMVEAGTFRADLLHRLTAHAIALPPLRERRADIPLLARYFLDGRLPFTAVALERLLTWSWPGNVRELRNVVLAAHAAALASGSERIGGEELPAGLGAASAPLVRGSAGASADPDALLRARIETALALRGGNVAQVARDLDMRRPGLYEAFARLGIDPARYRKA